MTLLSPAALVGLLICGPIVAMYFLKLRRRPLAVSSTLLWHKVLNDQQANAPWQKLRPSLLLLLQLLAALALILTLARPAISESRPFSGDLILIVDQSYPMQDHDVAPSRFAAAITKAKSLAAQSAPSHLVSVIGMGAEPDLTVASSSDLGTIGAGLAKLRPTLASPNLPAALSLAASLDRRGASTRAVVITSRESGINGPTQPLPFPMEVVRIGDSGGHLPRDVAVTAFNADRTLSHVQALARLSNFGEHAATVDVDLTPDATGTLHRTVTIPARQSANVSWASLPLTVLMLHLKIATSDDVAIDKDAWAVTGETDSAPGTRRILVVGKPDYFVTTALGLDPAVKLSSVSASGFKPLSAGQYDLVVFDGTVPSTLPPGSSLIVAPPVMTAGSSAGSLQFGATIRGGDVSIVPSAVRVDPDVASIIQYVNPTDVAVSRVRASTFPQWVHPLASAGDQTVLAAGSYGPTRVGLLAFDPQDSNWPLRLSFPVLIQNMVRYLIPGLQVSNPDAAVGEQVTLTPPAGATEIDVRRVGSGSTLVERIKPPFPPFVTSQRGAFVASSVGGPHRSSSKSFTINFAPDPPALAKGSGPATLYFGPHAQIHQITHREIIPRGLAWAVGLGALLLLTTEWWFAFRR